MPAFQIHTPDNVFTLQRSSDGSPVALGARLELSNTPVFYFLTGGKAPTPNDPGRILVKTRKADLEYEYLPSTFGLTYHAAHSIPQHKPKQFKYNPSVVRSVSSIAADIQYHLLNAKSKAARSRIPCPAFVLDTLPYIDALCSCESKTPSDFYLTEKISDIITYALSNMTGWRGPDAKRLRAELRSLITPSTTSTES